MMKNGMIMMSVEKASPELYQVSGRRLNWDRSDYHPLLAQREKGYQGRGGYLPGQEPGATQLSSIGYRSATEIRQAHDGNFLVVLADEGAVGQGGALGIFNRSIGPMQMGREDEANFLPSLTLMPGATGRFGEVSGAYRSPFPLPNGEVLASFYDGVDIGNRDSKPGYDLIIINKSGERRTLVMSPTGKALVEAVLVSPQPPPREFVHPPSTSATSQKDSAVVHYADLPLLATLQGANDRLGRRIDELRSVRRVRFYTHASPPVACTSDAHSDCTEHIEGSERVYVERIDLGSAPVHEDGSAFIRLPSNTPIMMELEDENGELLYRMREETQFGPFENINLGVPASAYHMSCGVCHGAISGRDLDVAFDIDALTHASSSIAKQGDLTELEP